MSEQVNLDASETANEEASTAVDHQHTDAENVAEFSDNQENQDVAKSEKPKVVFTEEQQAVVNEQIQRKASKTIEERRLRLEQERLRQEAERERDELRARLHLDTVPEIPEMPDPDLYYDDRAKYDAAVANREKAIRERAGHDAIVRAKEQAQIADAQKRQIETAQRQQEQLNQYSQRAETFGISAEQMQKDAQAVSQFVSNDLANFLVEDPQGPLIAGHLSRNFVQLDEIQRMSPVQAVSFIEREIRPNLAGTKKTTKAPKPAEVVHGNAPDFKSERLAGAVFE